MDCEVELTAEDQKTFQDFVKWVGNYNEGIMNQHNKASGSSISEKAGASAEAVIDIEPKKKISKKPTHNSDGSPKSGKDLESVLNAWTDSDDAA